MKRVHQSMFSLTVFYCPENAHSIINKIGIIEREEVKAVNRASCEITITSLQYKEVDIRRHSVKTVARSSKLGWTGKFFVKALVIKQMLCVIS